MPISDLDKITARAIIREIDNNPSLEAKFYRDLERIENISLGLPADYPVADGWAKRGYEE